MRRDAPKHCLALLRRMEAAVASLPWSHAQPLLCPQHGMAACYEPGGFYSKHRDNEKDLRWAARHV